MKLHKIRLQGHIDVPPTRMAEIAAALPEHIRLSREEPGCISFSVTPDTKIAGRFLVSETFSNQITFDDHQVRVKASDWGKITQGLVRSYQITELPEC